MTVAGRRMTLVPLVRYLWSAGIGRGGSAVDECPATNLPVLTAGLDLSVGMVFVLANCLASTLVVGSMLETAAGVVAVLVARMKPRSKGE